MKIKDVIICEMGKGVFNNDYACIVTENNDRWVYDRPQDRVDGSLERYKECAISDFYYDLENNLIGSWEFSQFEPFDENIHFLK